MADLKVDYSFI